VTSRRTWLALSGIAVLALLAVVAVRSQRDEQVVLLGDSIAQEAAPYLAPMLEDVDLVERFFGGTAPCDWSPAEVPVSEGGLVVISFTGNSQTPCMADGGGGQLEGEAVVDEYATDLGSLVDALRARGAEVLLVGQPARGPVAGDAEVVDGLNDVYRRLAEDDGVSYVDAGAALETQDGRFTLDLPCLPEEQACGPDGRNGVRHADGVHLCHVPGRSPCPEYSSGAFRFAAAIAAAIETR
jgi:hypothetical protein